MAGRPRLTASAVFGVLISLGSPVAAHAQRNADLALLSVSEVAALAPADPGALTGIVRDEQGEPIAVLPYFVLAVMTLGAFLLWLRVRRR